MKERLARAFWFLAPVIIATMSAALLAGLVEGAVYLDRFGMIVAGIGFSAPYALLLGFVVILGLRGLWAAWRPGRLVAAMREEPDGIAPRLAAWFAFFLLSAAITGVVAFNFVRWLVRTLSKSNVIGLASALGMVFLGALVVVLSRPVVDVLSAVFRALAGKNRHIAALMRPFALAIGFGVLALALSYISWQVSFVPRLGPLDLGVELYLAVWVPTLVLAYGLTRRFANARHLAIASAALTVACCAVMATAQMYRHDRLPAMLDIWGTESASGLAIDLTYDVETILDEFTAGEMALAARGTDTPRDVLLLTLDTVRADRTPMYGGGASMPGLERLAKSSAIFDWAFSPSNVTRRSIPAIITGLDPVRVRGRVKGWALSIDPRHVLLAERFRAAGYDTAGFFCCESHFGRQRVGTSRGIDHLVFDKPEDQMIKGAVKWLKTRLVRKERRPLFVWIHVYAPHNWFEWRKDENKGKRTLPSLVDSYDAALAKTDRWLKPLTTFLERPAVKRSMVVVVTSDHGEGLDEHGHRFHSSSLYNAQIRVPLLVRLPERLRNERIAQSVSLVDLLPTLLDAAGFDPEVARPGDGKSLMPLIRGDVPSDDEAVVFSHQVRDRSVSQTIDAIIVGRHKLIAAAGRKLELYDVVADPDETRNLAGAQPERVEGMATALRARMKQLSRLSPF